MTLDEFYSLKSEAYQLRLICKEPGPLSVRTDAIGVESHFVPDLTRPISLQADLRALRHLIRLLRSLRPHVLHTHSSKTGILGRIAGRISSVPAVIHTVHGFAFPFTLSRVARTIYYAIEYIGGHLCDALIVVNEEDKRIAIQTLRIRPEKVHLIPNGINTLAFGRVSREDRQEVRHDLFSDAGDDVVCIGMVGRLWRQKNPECLLRAAIDLHQRGCRGFRVILVGDGDLRGSLEAQIDRNKVGGFVRVLGWREDVPRLLGALDIFVLPSRWEGMPLAIIEAMSAGLPVVASDIPGNRDLVSEGIDGHLFSVDDHVGLADRLHSLIGDTERMRVMGSAARVKAVREFSLERRTQRIDALYRQLLSTPLAQTRFHRQKLQANSG